MPSSITSARISTALGLVVLLVALEAQGQAVEQRCLELGQNCICSEPLDNNDFPVPLAPNGSVDSHNPSDSSGSSAKQCGSQGYALQGFKSTGGIETPVATDVPARGVDRVFRKRDGLVVVRGLGEGVNERAPQRLCIRHYRRWDPTFPAIYTGMSNGSAECRRQKLFEVTLEEGFIQGSVVGIPPNRFNISYVLPDSDMSLPSSGETMSHFDCQDQWCRVELCLSGRIGTSEPLVVSGEIVGIEDGKRMTFSTPAPSRTLHRIKSVKIVNPWDNGGACQGKWNEMSLAMQAEWDVDQGQTIGPALEFEGETLPPSETPPAAPVLLSP